MSNPSSTHTQPVPCERLPWEPPSVARLTELTLATGGVIPGDGDTGTGSTVIP
jgi:hypothetical protein